MDEHLVLSHLGGYYTSNSDISFIEEICDECFDSDTVILTYPDGCLFDALLEYCSDLIREQGDLIDMLLDGNSKQNIIESLVYDFDDKRYMLECLESQEMISNKQKVILLNALNNSRKKQFNILRGIDIGGYAPKMMVKRKNKKSSN